MEWKDFETLFELGKGGFGKTYFVRHKKNEFVIKHMEFTGKMKKELWLKTVSAEKNALDLIHPNIVQIKRVVWQNTDNVLLHMEFAGNETLHSIIEECKAVDKKFKFHCISSMISGIRFIHEQNIVHLDVKPLNVLYNNVTNVWKLSDFGASVNLIECEISNNEGVPLSPSRIYVSCTVPFSAPEVFKGLPASKEMDIYSFACLMWCVFEWCNTLYPNVIPDIIIFSICSTDTRPHFKHALEKERILCEKSWSADPKNRPTAEDLEKRIQSLYIDGD